MACGSIPVLAARVPNLVKLGALTTRGHTGGTKESDKSAYLLDPPGVLRPSMSLGMNRSEPFSFLKPRLETILSKRQMGICIGGKKHI